MSVNDYRKLSVRCESYLADYDKLYNDGVINHIYHTNMKHYITVLSYFVCRKDMRKLIKDRLDDIHYTLGCIHKGLEGQRNGCGPSRIIGILNTASISGRYDKYQRFLSNSISWAKLKELEKLEGMY